jgi:hypothetical protein
MPSAKFELPIPPIELPQTDALDRTVTGIGFALLTKYSRRVRWAGHVARVGESRSAYVLVGKPEGMRILGRL